MIRISLPALLALVTLLAACSKDDDVVNPPPSTAADGVYILNEGNFQRGNSTLTWFDTEKSEVRNDVFRTVNGRDLGDVGNDIAIRDGKAYIVVNNSDKVEVIKVAGSVSVATWQMREGSSPRHVVFDANGIAYVSCLLTNTVQVVDAVENSLGPEIHVGANPEGMAIADGKLFVANSGFGAGRTVSVVDLESYAVTGTITVGDYPSAVAATGDGRVAVLCTGAYNDYSDPNDDTPGSLYLIDPQAGTVLSSATLGGHPQRLSIDTQRGMAYTVDGDVLRIDLASLTSERFIEGAFYAVSVNPETRQLYVTDPLDYQQAGKFLVYDLQGQKLAEHTVGIIPGAMVAVKQE